MATGLVYDPQFLEHDTGRGHPERPERLTASLDHLELMPWFGELVRYKPKPADPVWIETTHTRAYMARAKRACANGQPFLDSMDVAISGRSFDVAQLAAGAAMVLADALVAGEISNGFALVRPPGHHAELDTALGFCLFNNIAILARYLQRRHGFDKIAIMDWDVHHGNGTQHSFEEDPSVLYISTHQYPFYPGTGAASEIGIGRGRGATLNCPMVAGATDDDYERAFEQQIIPAIDRFKPEVMLISAGFDAHRDDPLAGIRLTTRFFRWMSEQLSALADHHANGRLIAVLEGGYNLQRLGECIAEHIGVLRKIGPT